ncbi:hypothetical protein FSP39_000466 [Pinctada imbricata]|uniref:Signal-induced proliferation-associated 1-like protein 2 n=1 Tax=Pinctada imbricata TaxID=66713 RepID=A0AA88XUT1_PINIB|nr:hypothetical protein FSP39_000466 [Pinctada imbricata]
MANSENVPIETIRKRSEKAVDYYKNKVIPSYSSRPNTASPMTSRNYDSTENINGIYTSHYGMRAAESAQRGKSKVGFADHEQKPSESNGETTKLNESFTRGGHRATIHGTDARKSWKGKGKHGKEKRSPKTQDDDEIMAPLKRRSRGLYRSNSNLEMDSIEYIDVDDFHNTSLRRDYGSTSSLDLLQNSSDSFFQMLNDYRGVNLDQRSPAPAKMQEFLRGRLDSREKERLAAKAANGSVVTDRSEDVSDSPNKNKSKLKNKDRKSRAKSITAETRPGLLTKLRGKDADSGARTPENVDVDLRAEDRLRNKAFVHYDCQSAGFDILNVLKNQKLDLSSKNTSTGASAASGQSRSSLAPDKDGPDVTADVDEGDGKSSDLVLSCPYFRNELGGEEERTISLGRPSALKKYSTQSHSDSAISSTRSPACCGVSILDSVPTPTGLILPHVVLHRGHVIEYVDHGASFYRHFFYGCEHQSYFGIDETLGPVAISIRKEKLDDRENNIGKAEYGHSLYRMIFRTSELTTLRGTILEDAIPCSQTRLGGTRSVTVKDVIEYTLPDLQSSCLKLASSAQKTMDQLLKLDEQGVSQTYKVGVMYCRSGQSSEEDMYNNEHSGPALEEFLNCIGQKVRLKGFDKYRAQLDNKTDSTGTFSVYTTYNNSEIMFHVSTMLPYTPNNPQQLLRKRHIGNDIVTIVFQEPGALPFTPRTVRSQFQHVFIIVKAHNPCTDNVHYSIAVSRSRDVPPFGPHIPENAFFPKSSEFADFLLAKIINAENAAHRCEKFRAMATRTRTEYLKDLATNHVTTTNLDSGSKLSKFSLGSGRKKDKIKQKVTPDQFATGAISWHIQVDDFSTASQVDGILAISSEVLVILEEMTRDVIFTVHCGAIIGWTSQASSIRIYFNQGESILVRPQSGEMEETDEICTRLKGVTPGCETTDLMLKRNGMGQLGFHVQSEGVVTDVEKFGFAWDADLKKGSRLVEICKVATATLTHEQIVDLLRTSATVKVTVIPPLEDGTPRGVATLNTNCHSTSLTTLKAACKATENIQQRQKEVQFTKRSWDGDMHSNHRDLCKTSSDSSEYLEKHKKDIDSITKSSSEYLSVQQQIEEFSKLLGSDEFLSKNVKEVSKSNQEVHVSHHPRDLSHHAREVSHHTREVSHLSSSSTELSYQLRESSLSISTTSQEMSHSAINLHRRDSRKSSSSSEITASPTIRDAPKNFDIPQQRGSLTLPLQKKPATPTRGESRNSPSHNFLPQNRPLATSSLQRNSSLHHAYTDSALSSRTTSSYDEGYNSRHTTSDNIFPGEEVRHERTGSRDSSDYIYISAGTRQPWNPRHPQNQSSSKWFDSSSSGDSTVYGNHLHTSSDTSQSMTSLQAPPSGYRKQLAPGADYSSNVQHGNISLELLKQSQNTKYLLNHGQDPNRNVNSSANLSDTSFSSGSSQNSAPQMAGYRTSRDDVARKRADLSSTNSKGRPGVGPSGHTHRKPHLEVSPLSSENSSPRSSHKNLSGMSSEESLNSRLRPGVTGRPTKAQSNDQLQEELKHLINLEINNSDLRGLLSQAPDRSSIRLTRTMSDESLHGFKGATVNPSRGDNSSDVLFTVAPPVPALPKEVLKDQRLSPRAMYDDALSAKARQILSRHSPNAPNNNVPLPESTAGLDWSNLVNVATKAIESTDSSPTKSQTSSTSVSSVTRDVKKTPAPQQPVTSKDQKTSLQTATNYSSAAPVWRSVAANPQQRIQELETKVEQLERELDQEQKENASLEAEVQELRAENVRLQEESQTAAAQLRKFTEWFFQTIDRQ